MKEVASKTNDVAGDGTTTAVVLAQAIIAEGFSAVNSGANPMVLKRGIDKAVEWVGDFLKKSKKSVTSQEKIKETADSIYQDLREKDIGVLYDEREGKTAGEKFADADLIGIPCRVVVSEKTLSAEKIELKKRNENKVKLVGKNELLKYVG